MPLGRPAIQVEGLTETRKALRKAGATTATKAIRTAHKDVGKFVEKDSRSRAPSGTRQQARAGKTLLGKGTAGEAVLALRNTDAIPYGIGAFLGGKRPQFPEWVGNNWDLPAGVGPYVVADSIGANFDEILELFETQITAAIESAGLDVT